jgi:lipopolysaccharide/colanic/teichoic acid biosynthesis glycosyltransferase
MEFSDKTNFNILYIGGDVTILNQHIESGQFNIVIKENSLSAVRWLTEKNSDVDIVLCEMYTPGINAIDINKLFKAKNIIKKQPFIVISHKLDPEARQQAFENKLDDFMTIPIDLELLMTRLKFLYWYKLNYQTKVSEEIGVNEYKIPVVKRFFDIIAASVAFLILSPILITAAFLIRLESKGPIFYISKRVGTGYKVFDFFKFRSMYTGSDARLKELMHLNQYIDEEETEPQISQSDTECEECDRLGHPCSSILFIEGITICETKYLAKKKEKNKSSFIKIKNDPRVTRIGHFIRNTSIDELPQLINVLKGDMSIVGNRPLPLYEAEMLTSDEWGERFLGPTGITGLWQVNKRGKGSMSEEERKKMDNQYARNNSFWGDIIIIFRTVPALFQKENV